MLKYKNMNTHYTHAIQHLAHPLAYIVRRIFTYGWTCLEVHTLTISCLDMVKFVMLPEHIQAKSSYKSRHLNNNIYK